MPYEYLAHGVTSDVTFRTTGHDLDALFAAAADATTNLMVNRLESIAPAVTIPVTVYAEELDLLLLRFLDELVFHKDAERLLLRATDVHVTLESGACRVGAVLTGETIDPAKHELEADIKAVTLHGLYVRRLGAGWQAEVTLDV
jgi:SHS2 domain-containing protein